MSDSVTGLAETYASPNVSNNDTLSVSAFTVNDGNSGNNYTVNFTNAVGTITQRPLTIAAVTYTKTYDGTPIAMMSPVATNLVTPRDYVTGLTEVFASAAAGPETLMVALYTVNDGNNGNNYSVTLVSAPGTINQFPLTPSETGVDKVYDSTTTGTVTFSDNRIQKLW